MKALSVLTASGQLPHAKCTVQCAHLRSLLLGSLKKNTTLEYSTRVVQEGDRRCEKSTLNDLAYLTPLRIPLMNPVCVGNFSPAMGARNQVGIGLSYRPASLCSLATQF
jgi:hypothetical protein